jgi:4'-phosphopantetheinyl transferase
MIVRFLDVTTVSPDRLSLWESWLAAEKRQRIDHLPEKSRQLSLCADGLAREMLAQKLNLAPEAISFTYTANGKPQTIGAFFSVSHSGCLVGCAVSDAEVGLDMERIRPVPERLGRALKGKWQTEGDFWQLWTRREAAIKCRGGVLGEWKQEGEEGSIFTHPIAPEGYVATICEKKV